jgi:pyruvate formate lyase activating enzyme
MKEAMFYKHGQKNEVVCGLCNHHCHIKEGKRGLCGVRENKDGKLYSLVYGRLVAEHIDPIEKKPLFHFLPGSKAYSISTVGCNFRCLHCQNYDISQYPHFHNGEITGNERSAESVVADAIRQDCASVCYTYVEPTIFYEFAFDCSILAHKQKLKNVFVSNGYMSPDVTRHLATVLDGINIDIKWKRGQA